MSLMIDVDKVVEVLLADGWHTAKGFMLDNYEYVAWHPKKDEDFIVQGGREEGLLPVTGFEFTDRDGLTVSGPITSILAVKTTE